VHRKCFRQGRL